MSCATGLGADVLVVVPERLRHHLLAALVPHVRKLRRNGGSAPPELEVFMRGLATPETATARRRPPPLDESGAAPESAAMPLYVNYAEAGRLLGISKRTVERGVARGELPAVVVLGAKRIRRRDLEAYAASLRPVNGSSGVEPGALPPSARGGPTDSPGQHSAGAPGSTAVSTQDGAAE